MKQKDMDLKLHRDAIKRIVNKRFNVTEEENNALISTWFFVSVIMIIAGGLFKSIHSIVAGTILLIFLYIILK